MASIKEHKDKDGKTRFHVQIRIKGTPPQYASFKRKTDAERWIQQTESAIREGRHFKTTEAKKHTFGELIDRYIKYALPTKKKCEQRQGAQLIWWKKQLGSYLLSDITPALIVEQRDILLRGITKQGKVRSPATDVGTSQRSPMPLQSPSKNGDGSRAPLSVKSQSPENHEGASAF